MRIGFVGKPPSKYLVLRIFRRVVSPLLAIDKSHLRIGERSQQALQPIIVDRIDVGAGNDNKVTAGFLNTEVKRAAKRKLVGLDGEYLHRIARCDRQSRVSGAGIHDDDLHVLGRLLGDAAEPPADVLFFIVATDYG